MFRNICRGFAAFVFLWMFTGAMIKKNHPEWGYTTYENGKHVHKEDGAQERERIRKAKKYEKLLQARNSVVALNEQRQLANMQKYGNLFGPGGESNLRPVKSTDQIYAEVYGHEPE